MQPPPMSEYRPGGYGSGEFVADKVIGIILMVLNACGVIGGLFLTAGAGAIGASGVQVEGKTIAAAGIGVLGMLVIAMSAVGIILGYGIMKSAKWGFIGGAIVFGLSTISNLAQLSTTGSQGILSLVIAIAGAGYCIMRLTGSLGPKPV